VTPGIDFGKNGEGYLRFSYANSLENIAEGLNRLEQYLNDVRSHPTPHRAKRSIHGTATKR